MLARRLCEVLALLILSDPGIAQTYHGPEDSRIKTALVLDAPSTGVSFTPDGRLFLVYARVDGSTGPQIAEQESSYTSDPTNAQRIGPDGSLWLVDTGSPAFGAPVIFPDGPKVVKVNVTTNKVARVYNMGNAALSSSLLDDIRFNPAANKAYITDAGVSAIIVLDLESGVARRLLNNDISGKQYMPVSAEGQLLRQPSGAFEYIYADQMEVSPNGKYFYFQPASGGMSRIETKYLDQAFYNSSLAEGPLASYVEPHAHTPSTGGTAIDALGNVYNSDTDSQRIIKIAPNGTMTTLVQDPRLLWVDAMWIDAKQRLWMPAAQLNRGTPFNNGYSFVKKPLYVYTIDIGAGPSRIDHA